MKSLLVTQRMAIFLSIIFIITMLFFVPNLWAKSTRYCVVSETELFANPGNEWFQGGVYHNHGSVGGGTETGDIEAVIDFIQNEEINFKTGNGHFYGEQTLSVTEVIGLEDMTGSFEGRFTSDFVLGVGWELKYVAHGSGDFEGMKLFQTCIGSGITGTLREDCNGFIFDPHGTIPDEPCE
jgi:hypothetical protein